MDVTKPYQFIGFGAMEVTKPYKFIGFGAMDATKPYKFIGFGAMDAGFPGTLARNCTGTGPARPGPIPVTACFSLREQFLSLGT